MTGYQHKLVQKLSELHEKYGKEMGSGFSGMAMVWKAISPEIPMILKGLDGNEELLSKIKIFLQEMTEAMKEDETKLVEFEDKIEEKKKSEKS